MITIEKSKTPINANGEKHGYWEVYNTSGLEYSGFYVNDKRHGFFKMYTYGKLVLSLHYTNDIPDGEVREYDNYGDLIKISNLSMGVLDGEQKIYKNNIIYSKANYKNGLVDGEYIQYDDGGKILYTMCYNLGKRHGKSSVYNVDKSLILETEYYNDKVDGLMKEFDCNGELITIAYYEEDIKIF